LIRAAEEIPSTSSLCDIQILFFIDQVFLLCEYFKCTYFNYQSRSVMMSCKYKHFDSTAENIFNIIKRTFISKLDKNF
jgi:hypothetical protein